MKIAANVFLVSLLTLVGSVRSRNEITLSGDYYWKHMDHTGRVEATFAKAGEGIWAVAFRFVWDGEEHVYRGTAEGNLVDGRLHGRIVGDNPTRSQVFFFDGVFDRGRFTGSHAALQTGGGTHATGTLTLGR